MVRRTEVETCFLVTLNTLIFLLSRQKTEDKELRATRVSKLQLVSTYYLLMGTTLLIENIFLKSEDFLRETPSMKT